MSDRPASIQNEGINGPVVPGLLDDPPLDDQLTSYDREHMTLYLRLLDASRDEADWREVVAVLFGLDPDDDPQRYQHIHDSHLARARWMSERGYRHLIRGGRGTP